MPTFEGTPGDDLIVGSPGDDFLLGGYGADTLVGGEGNDWLEGGPGPDKLIGGAGFDYASYINVGLTSLDIFRADLGTGLNSLEAFGDTYDGIEGLIGSVNSEYLAGNDVDNYIFGLSGNDYIFGRRGVDSLVGGEGDDTLNGGEGGDYLMGGPGDDTASYAEAPDRVVVDLLAASSNSGEAAGDSYESIEKLWGSSYDDSLRGTDTSDYLIDFGGSDSLYGRGGNDFLFAGSDNDYLTGGEGADVMVGGDGFDLALYTFATTGVTVSLLNGAGTGEALGDSFSGIEGLAGSRFGDSLAGDQGRNIIFGGAGNDSLFGYGGDDALIGGPGDDELWGDDRIFGYGTDLIVFGVGDGHDTIFEFNYALSQAPTPVDVIQLSVDLGVKTFEETIARAQQLHTSVVITFDSETSITVYNTSITSLTADNFLFVG